MQTLSHASKPIDVTVVRRDGRDGVLGHLDDERVAAMQRLLELPVEAHRRVTPTAHGDLDPQHRAVREQHLPEGQRVRADGRHEDARSERVHHRPARGHGVGGGASGRGDDQTVGVDRGDVCGVDVAVQLHHAAARASVDHDVIQDLPMTNAPRPCLQIRLLRTPGDHVQERILALRVVVVADDVVLQARAHRQRHVPADHLRLSTPRSAHAGERALVVPRAEGREEAERAHVEGDDRRHREREERGGEEERAVAAQRDDEVHDASEAHGLLEVSGQQEQHLFVPRFHQIGLQLLEDVRLDQHGNALRTEPGRDFKKRRRRVVVVLLLHDHYTLRLALPHPTEPHHVQRLLFTPKREEYGRHAHDVLSRGGDGARIVGTASHEDWM